MLDKLVLVGLGLMLGCTLTDILHDMAMGIKPAPLDVSWLVTAGLLVVGLLTLDWWERRR